MAESSLAVTYTVLQQEVGDFLGFGRTIADWDSEQADSVANCVRRGLRQFYYPEPMDGSNTIYEWTFLKSTLSVTLLEGERTVLLPDDFLSLDGNVTISSADASVRSVVTVVGAGLIRQNYSLAPDTTGPPMLAAVELRDPATTISRGQRWEMRVFPEADDDYTLEAGYDVVVGDLSDVRPYPYGGAQHGETVLASCVAAAEVSSLGEPGPQTDYFRRRLMASIGQDKKLKPSRIGRMSNPSEAMSYRRRHWDNVPVTYNGVNYD